MLKIHQPELPAPAHPGIVQRERACDLCRSRDVQLISLVDRRGKPLPTAVCTGCGLISHLQIPTETEIQDYYRAQYRTDYHGEITPSAKRVVKAWRCGQTIFRRLQPHLAADQQVLEVGAGLGCTVKAFELGGYAASGIEPGGAFSEYAQKRIRARVVSCGLEDLPDAAQCDLVLLVHVIEHFRSPRLALQKIHSLLREDGHLYIECPNVAAPHAAPGKLFHYAHIFNFTQASLKMLAQACGFRLVKDFSSASDRNLRVLLARDEPREVIPPRESYLSSLAAIQRYNRLTYHLRARYVADRIRSIVHQLSCTIVAQRQLDAILETCARSARPETVDWESEIRRAA